MRDSNQLRRNILPLVTFSLAAIWSGLTVLSATAIERSASTNSTVQTAPSNSTHPAPIKQNSYKPYFVEFRARSAASYGHMYVLYGQVNSRGEIIKSDIAGLHPSGDANDCENCSVITWTLGHLIFVPSETGASDGDLEEKYVTARYRVMVDADTFKNISAHIAKLKADTPLWNALWRNCVSFGNDIAGFMGLKTPTFIWLEPKDYVEDLRELNGGKPQQPLKFAAPIAGSDGSAISGKSSVPNKPKKQPLANLSTAQ
jgi:hypothetical protein